MIRISDPFPLLFTSAPPASSGEMCDAMREMARAVVFPMSKTFPCGVQ